MSPIELAEQLGFDHPTAQQQAVISASVGHPHLVVAGAGSGKTATMANRVVWLVANGLAAPSEILGLTFTRKAAGELDERIARQLAMHERSIRSDAHAALDADRPTVSTYNAFAAGVYRDHALLIGYEPDAVVISESIAWRLAYRVVSESTDSRLPALDLSPATVVDAVLRFARELADHGASGREVARYANDLSARIRPVVESIPQKTRRERFQNYLDNVSFLPLLVDLASEYQAAKRARGFIEFSDQVALAHRIISEHHSVAESYRSRFRIVLLDEYQDTSVAQTRFLSELFRGQSVMAVGDPDQSIYGFRGASAANLSRFSRDFGSGETFPLSVSWRNSQAVLTAANTVAGLIERTVGISKDPLGAKPFAETGAVELRYRETILDEAASVAEWFDARRAAADPPTMAVLLRAKKHFTVFADALRERGIPVHILGLSGLLAEPVIADLTSALAVLADSTANAELLRLLSGARWAIGPADIRALHTLARTIADHDDHGRLRDRAARDAARNSAQDLDTSSLVEALDALAADRIPRSEWLDEFSADGLPRLRQVGAQLAAIRRRTGLRLADIVDVVIGELQLDIEAVANPAAALAVNALEAFHDLVHDFLTLADDASLSAFLSWLDTAEQRESLAPRQEPAEPGAVQLMTIHAAKGLEWDYVALPRFVADEMPSKSQDVAGWLARGRLPYEYRGDRDELARLDWDTADSIESVSTALQDYLAAVAAAQRQEELRLGYVAVTRPKRELLVTGSWWGGQVQVREPGELMRAIAELTLGEGATDWPAPSQLPGPPQLTASGASWPLVPLGQREQTIRAAARAVESAGELTDSALLRLIRLLVAERDADSVRANDRPTRIPASRVKEYFDDASRVHSELDRPMPQRPYRATRLGTLFHSWVEQRGATGLEIDAFDTELDLGDAVQIDRLNELKATFERSPWANLKPIDVEREIHLPLAGQVFICKIDAVYNVSGIDLGQPLGADIQIVDWKTGAAPADTRDLELKQTQLALYRLAYAAHLGIDPARIDAVFYFVATNEIVRPTALLSEAEFVAAWKELG